MTLGNKGGQVVGIDEKEGIRLLGQQLGIEDVDEMAEKMYPEKEYDPDRTKEPLPAPVPKALPQPGGQPQNPEGQQEPPNEAPLPDGTVPPKPKTAKEALTRLVAAVQAIEAQMPPGGSGES
jgi:hypothetical protein